VHAPLRLRRLAYAESMMHRWQNCEPPAIFIDRPGPQRAELP